VTIGLSAAISSAALVYLLGAGLLATGILAFVRRDVRRMEDQLARQAAEQAR